MKKPLILKQSTPFTYRDVEITPEIAQQMLATNTNNRKVKGTNVDYLGRKILNGSYNKDVSPPLKFDSNGVLMDGQHRLLAVIRTGISIVIDVKVGLDPALIADIDSGVERNLQDRYGLLTGRREEAGIETPRLNSVLKTFDPHRPKRSADEIEDAFREFDVGIRVVNKVATGRTQWMKADVMAAFVIAANVHPQRVRALLQGLADGKTDATALFKYLFQGNGVKHDAANTRTNKVLFGIRSYLDGDAVKNLQQKSDALRYFAEETIKKGGHAPICETFLAKKTVAA